MLSGRARWLSTIGLALGLAATCGPSQAAPADGPKPTLYVQVCAQCHDKGVGPVLLGRRLAAPAIQAIVRRGLNGMPAFRPTEIPDAELAALSRFLQAAPEEHQL